MLKKLLGSAIVAATVLSAGVAQAYYDWNEYVGNIWISEWTVESGRDYNKTQVFINVSMPTCDSWSYLNGNVEIDYYSNDGGWVENYTIGAYGREGYQGWLSVTAWGVTMSEEGTIQVTDNTYCSPF